MYDIESNDIEAVVLKMSTNKAAGPDGITVRLLKDDIDILCPILCNIFNHCLHASAYPCPLKKARVASIYKGGDPTDQSSYRPISVLSALNNLCEKILVARMHKFLDKYDIICPQQHDFRSQYSTSTAVLSLTQAINFALNNNKLVAVVNLDLKKHSSP